MVLKRDERSETPDSVPQREPYPNSTSVADMDTNAAAVLSRAALGESQHLRQLNAVWLGRARRVQQASRELCLHAHKLQVRGQQLSRRYILIECAWCQQHIRWEILQGCVPMTETSHGICPTCYTTVTRELGLLNRRMPTAVWAETQGRCLRGTQETSHGRGTCSGHPL